MPLLLALALALMGAQQAEQFSIVEGVVLDSVTRLPVAGANVVLARVDRPGVGIGADIYDTRPSAGTQDPKANSMAVVTAEHGTFRFVLEGPAKFALFVDASGYVRTPLGISPGSTHRTEPGSPKANIVIRLVRQLSISGRVTDADTGEPLRNLLVLPKRYRSTGVGRILIPDGEATTGEEGRFTLDRLPPGVFYLEMRHPLNASITEPKSVEDFRNDVRKSYPPTWYPGVERREEALPVTLMEGAAVEGLEIRISKRRMASLRGRVLSSEDTSSKSGVPLSLISVRREISSAGFSTVARGQLKAGSEFEIERVPPGAYYLSAETGRLTAVLPFAVGEENQEGLDLHLRPGVTVTGRIRIDGREERADEPAVPVSGTRVGFMPVVRMLMSGDPDPVEVAKDGAFTLQDVIADQYRVYVAKPPGGYALSELLYNGSVCPNGIVTISATADVHRLEIKLAQANGSLTATATDGIRPAPGAAVLLIPDPVVDDAIDIGFELRKAQADDDGRATITGLLPGRYRLTAYPPNSLWGDDPNLKAKLRAGQEVRVSASQVALIEVRTQPAP